MTSMSIDLGSIKFKSKSECKRYFVHLRDITYKDDIITKGRNSFSHLEALVLRTQKVKMFSKNNGGITFFKPEQENRTTRVFVIGCSNGAKKVVSLHNMIDNATKIKNFGYDYSCIVDYKKGDKFSINENKDMFDYLKTLLKEKSSVYINESIRLCKGVYYFYMLNDQKISCVCKNGKEVPFYEHELIRNKNDKECRYKNIKSKGMGYVYIIASPAFSDTIKIGHSSNVKRRLCNQTAWVPKQYEYKELYSVKVKDSYSLEQLIHILFSDYRLHKKQEFFKSECKEEVISFIEMYINDINRKIY